MHTGILQYHIVWCTKYRLKVLNPDVQKRLKEIVLQKCEEKGWELVEIEVMEDHVHCFIRTNKSDITVKHIASQLKGVSSNILRKDFKHLKSKLPTLWTRSYYAGTIGHVSEKTVKRYIKNQKSRT